ncbi:hypothetical protein K9857_00010 [Pseudomonas sp. REP124]|uniref:hypothetical protein n=1 Tax=Pseudomonas sp. REP124 TaxID=2875731 RepID=UPI001CCCFF25|nr:hypothetical protein [Pseudomonas sp. REP124]MBZ9779935.1 hypothetical protein [Pseudomonas sp. REP124]
MLNFNKVLDLPSRLSWKYSNEQKLLEWTIRARNYNTFVANSMFWVCFIVIMIASILIYRSMDDDPLFSAVLTMLYFSIVTFALISITHQRVNFAYRFTRSGVEYCEWKAPPKWVLPFLKLFTGITAIIFIFLATIDPAFLIGALIGPGGMGLMYLSMANSKGFQSLHTEYHHYFINWTTLTSITVATNRDMVELEFKFPEKNSNDMISGSQYVFFKRRKKEQVVELIKANLPPSVPCVIGKVDVLN